MSPLDVNPFMGALGNSWEGGGPLARLLPQPCTVTSLHRELIAASLSFQSKNAYQPASLGPMKSELFGCQQYLQIAL